jgi:hypothetical protein
MVIVSSEKKLSECWLWEEKALRIFVGCFILIPPVIAVMAYPIQGPKSGYICFFSGIGLLFWLLYGMVGKKVDAVRRSLDGDGGEIVDSLMVNGKVQSPGIAVLRESELELWPVIGQSVTVSLRDIVAVRETRWFNGTGLCGKRGIWITIPGRGRLGFAVAKSVAKRWRSRLAPH